MKGMNVIYSNRLVEDELMILTSRNLSDEEESQRQDDLDDLHELCPDEDYDTVDLAHGRGPHVRFH